MKLFPLLLLLPFLSQAQEKPGSENYKTILRLDSIVFEEGFNKCNFKALEEVLDTGLIFLHDVAGAQDYKGFFEATRKNICGNPNGKPLRKRVEATLEVYPLYNNNELYGLIQTGQHDFYFKEPGKPEVRTGTAKYIHTWLLKEGEWKLVNVLSIDHKAAS